ncbi:MAG: chemotaxis protein CheW, partial [bacterium]
LYLVIRLGADRYAIDSSLVEEVVSLVRLKALPGAPMGVAGVMNYRADAVPVIDLNLVALGTPTPPRIATRIIVVRHASDGGDFRSELLGLLVPQATETRRIDDDAFVDAGVATDGAAYLGPVLATLEGVIQRVSVAALLTDELRDALRRESATT